MNLDQFFEKLAQTPRDWKLCSVFGEKAAIRRGEQGCEGYQCPIAAVLNQDTVDPEYDGVFEGAEDGGDLIDAADNINADPKLRKRMMKACGLAE